MDKQNYSTHRMTNYDWMTVYERKMGSQAFNEFLNKVFARLASMVTGTAFDIRIKVREENRDLFIKSACYFIACGNSEYCFSDDYTVITRNAQANIKEVLTKLQHRKEKKKMDELQKTVDQ